MFDQWLYRLTSDKPREPQEGDLASLLRLKSVCSYGMGLVFRPMGKKKGISSSLATPTNVVDCVPGGHFLHFVGTGNNRSLPRFFLLLFDFLEWNSSHDSHTSEGEEDGSRGNSFSSILSFDCTSSITT